MGEDGEHCSTKNNIITENNHNFEFKCPSRDDLDPIDL